MIPRFPPRPVMQVSETPVSESAYILGVMRSGDWIDYQLMLRKVRRGVLARLQFERAVRGAR